MGSAKTADNVTPIEQARAEKEAQARADKQAEARAEKAEPRAEKAEARGDKDAPGKEAQGKEAQGKGDKQPPAQRTASGMTWEEVSAEAQQWLDVIATPDPTPEQRDWVVRETLANFDDYYNRGFIEYRKSVVEAGDDAPNVEWRGEGCVFEDVKGRRFIDCLGGFGIYSAGIQHPTIVKAVTDQLRRMALSTQELLDPLRGALAELLGELVPGNLQKCFFISNGTDAIEGALKLARMYTGKTGFISTVNAFHGKSYGALSLMGKAEYRTPFEPLMHEVHFVPYGDARAVEQELKKAKQVGTPIAAVVAEPVQGEAGAIVPPKDYWPRLRKICDKYKVLLIADEVQTGLGRTGKLFGVNHWDVAPDIMCLGKALGGGVMPLSAFISTPEIWKVLEENPFIHSSTFGGNPLACAAGIAAVHVTLKEDLPRQAAERGGYFKDELRKLKIKHREVLIDVRGLGLLIGMEFPTTEIGYQVAAGLFRRGVLVSGTMINAKAIRIEPALNIPYELIDEVIDKLDDTLTDLS